MPHGDAGEWTFDNFKEKAEAAGGEVTDEMMEDFRKEITDSLALDATSPQSEQES